MNPFHKNPVLLGLLTGFALVAVAREEVAAQGRAAESFLMCSPGKMVFSEDFTPGTVSERWGIRAHYEIADGILRRSRHEPQETARIFLKDAAFHNVIFRFDFRFEGASEIRLMTGGGGGYNTVIQVSPDHFQVNTAKRNNEFAPSMQGECAFRFKEGKWHTMTVEFHGEEVVAHVDKEHFVVGRHPIIDTERSYMAFQVTGSGASFDNFSVRESVVRSDWNNTRARLTEVQASRPAALKRDAREQYDLIMLNLRDRLSRGDATYRALLRRHEKLHAALKADYPRAFQTQKELSKEVARTRKEIKQREPRFKEMESAVHKARKKVKDYIHSVHEELDRLPRHMYYAAFEKHRKSMRNDSRLVALEKITVTLEADLHLSLIHI